jgi:Leucine-rich repeat (LRR) protein
LKSLSLPTLGISEGLSSLSKLPSLSSLELQGSDSWDPQLSSVGNIKQLTSLRLEAYNFSPSSVPSWIGSLKSLVHLRMYGCNFTGPLPYQIGNLANLKLLEFESCKYTGQPIPPWIGNLTRLTKLAIQGCGSSAGSIPSNIGNLTQLEVIWLRDNNLVGEILTKNLIYFLFCSYLKTCNS